MTANNDPLSTKEAELASLRAKASHAEIYRLERHGLAAQLDAAQARLKGYRKALEKIAAWSLPETGKFWDDEKTSPVSYEAEYGSNGARSYIRGIAASALSREGGADDCSFRSSTSTPGGGLDTSSEDGR